MIDPRCAETNVQQHTYKLIQAFTRAFDNRQHSLALFFCAGAQVDRAAPQMSQAGSPFFRACWTLPLLRRTMCPAFAHLQ
jgi:hypothetical protein